MKLTKEKKELLTKIVLAETYLERKNALQKRWNDFSERVYMFFYQEHEKAMDMLPKGAFTTQVYISIRLRKEDGEMLRKGLTIYFTEEKTKPNEISAGLKNSTENTKFVRRQRFYDLHNPATLPVGHWIDKEFSDLKWQQELLISDTLAIKEELNRLLASVTTKKRLLEAWPAGAEWIEKAMPDPPSNLPAVIETKKLNTLLCDAVGEKSPTC